jgi:hypothetical protein
MDVLERGGEILRLSLGVRVRVALCTLCGVWESQSAAAGARQRRRRRSAAAVSRVYGVLFFACVVFELKGEMPNGANGTELRREAH